MKRRTIALAAVIVAAVFIGIPAGRLLAARRKPAAAPAAAPVLARKLARGPISNSLFYPGVLTAQSTVAVPAKIAGRILAVHVREGQRVEADALLVTLEDRMPRLQAEQAKAALDAAAAQRQKAVRGVRPEELESAKASLEQAQQDLDKARSDFDRTARLYSSGAVSKSAYEEADNQIRAATTKLDNARRSVNVMEEGATAEDLALARANEDAMRAQYDLASIQLENAEVRTPVSGLVAKVLAKEGNMAAPGMPLVAIVQDRSVLANLSLPERTYGKVAGNPRRIRVVVRPIAYAKQRSFPGLVTSVGEMIDPTSRTYLVEAAIENPDRALKPGMYVDAELVLEHWDDALLLPVDAVARRGGGAGCFVLEGAGPWKARFVPIATGAELSGSFQVLSGLSGEELVILEGAAFLEDGQEVAPAAGGGR
jgi:RND family efflux transporter MFP subunit